MIPQEISPHLVNKQNKNLSYNYFHSLGNIIIIHEQQPTNNEIMTRNKENQTGSKV